MTALPDQPTVVLAYSGGLDTSIIVPWLREHYDARVLCLVGDVGQGDDMMAVAEKAVQSGAAGCRVVDLRRSLVTDYIWPTLRAGALYARKYLLGTAIARPLIGKAQAEFALSVGADALAHGCTGKGNDQVRFELAYMAFAPHLAIIAPWREWSIASREDALVYASEHAIPVDAAPDKIYSRDANLWHMSHEGGPLEDPDFEPPEDMFMLTTAPESAPDDHEYLTVDFESGYPVALNGEGLEPVELLTRLNAVAGAHGIGRADIVEDRLVGMKSRGVYETPGGTVLFTALRELESMALDRRCLALKDDIATRYADLVYEGRWWSAERRAMDALVDSLLEKASGSVRLKLFKGSLTIAGRRCARSLYDSGLASFGAGEYDHADAGGFIRLFGLPTRVAATRDPATESGGSWRPSVTPGAEDTKRQASSEAGASSANGRDCRRRRAHGAAPKRDANASSETLGGHAAALEEAAAGD